MNSFIFQVITNYQFNFAVFTWSFNLKNKIGAAPFVVVKVDETTDVTNQAQISVRLRFVAKTEADCEVKEAFLCFDDGSGDGRTPAFADGPGSIFFVCVLLPNTLQWRAHVIFVNLTDAVSASPATNLTARHCSANFETVRNHL